MANVDAPFGFKPIRTLDGSPIKTRTYEVDASGATMGVGDVVVMEADGNIERAGASPADGTVTGVIAQPHTTGTAASVLVWDNPSIVFAAQTDDGTASAVTQAVVGSNLNIVDTAPSNGISQQELDESSSAATNTLPFRVLGLHKEVGNAFGEFNQLEVIINNHALRGGSGTGI